MKKKKEIDFSRIEKKWQNKWEKSKIFQVKEDLKKKKYYVLEMYPYPSASGLHMGHAFNYIIGDVIARYMRMQGFNVLHPMGFDSFGLPAENAAIKAKVKPRKFTEDVIRNFIKQMKMLGLSYDWKRKLESHNENYYKWNQWIFLQMYKNGLIYRKKSSVNYCPKCDTVLANEQVHDGRCWRHKDTKVEIRNLEQWFIKITNYAEELLKEIDNLNWPERIKIMQKNWIGKSEGTEIVFEINGEKWPIFTTRADTLFGVTFLVVSAQHPRLQELVTKEQKKNVDKLLKKIKSIKQEEIDQLEKEGIFTGSYALHPLTSEFLPVYVGNFVLADYGSGMVMGVPCHDQRDFEFAKKYKIPIKIVVQPKDKKIDIKSMKKAHTDYGILINSNEFDGLSSDEAIEHIAIALQEKKLGRKTINYKLRDWLVSRQRYWGTPIPMVYCDKCGIVPVKEKDLPVKLPEKVKFGKGNPLTTSKKFIEVKCPKCNEKARRETDTMDTFFDSSWYYIRFVDPNNKDKPFDKNKASYWLNVDFYTGGAEHATMHLIYARFFTKFLRDIKMLDINEPFNKLFNQGMIHGEDGFVMSKSRGNVIIPEQVSKQYGIDTARLFLMSNASPDKDREWSEDGIDGTYKFINKTFNYFSKFKIGSSNAKVESKANKAIKGVTKDIENLNYNLAIIKLRNLFDIFENQEISKKDFEAFLKMFSLFCPHIAEELWSKLGNKDLISLSEWPKYDEKKINEKYEQIEKDVEKTIDDIQNIIKLIQERQKKEVTKVYLYILPNEKEFYDVNELERRIGKKIMTYSVNDKDKYDPEGKTGKAKPGRPAIYLE